MAPSHPSWPKLSPKKGLSHRTLLEDQILLIDNVLSRAECKAFVDLIEHQALEITPPEEPSERWRSYYHISHQSPSFAASLFAILAPHLPAFPYPASDAQIDRPPRAAHSLNSHIQLYKYEPGQYFGSHYAHRTQDARTGTRSEWTLLVYLSGLEDGVHGGETVFYKPGRIIRPVVAPLTRGTALLHRNGYECLMHEDYKVKAGTKYVLRTDVMFLP